VAETAAGAGAGGGRRPPPPLAREWLALPRKVRETMLANQPETAEPTATTDAQTEIETRAAAAVAAGPHRGGGSGGAWSLVQRADTAPLPPLPPPLPAPILAKPSLSAAATSNGKRPVPGAGATDADGAPRRKRR
jgi:hypothetical protein